MIRALPSLALLSVLAACNMLAAEPDTEPARVETEEQAYVAVISDRIMEFSLSFTYTNRSGALAYLHGCKGPFPPVIEKRIGDDWTLVYDPVVNLCFSPPTQVAPGETYRYNFRVLAGLPSSNVAPEWEAEEVDGVYRLRWSIEEAGRERIALSNEFTLVEEVAN